MKLNGYNVDLQSLAYQAHTRETQGRGDVEGGPRVPGTSFRYRCVLRQIILADSSLDKLSLDKRLPSDW
jgi:hypothetical protein